jgi:hypothetical protein
MRHDPDAAPTASIPADVDTPDKIVYGLTARQLAIFAVTAVAAYGVYRGVGEALPRPVLFAVLIPYAGVAVVVALGRRDGMSMDRWVVAAVRYCRSPRRSAPAQSGRPVPVPGWAPQTMQPVPMLPVLRLPATAIAESGVIDAGQRAVVLVACTTVNIRLRTGEEQAALLAAFGRWLNSVNDPVQIVVSTQRVDLSAQARRISAAAEALPNPALAAVSRDYAAFLDALVHDRDPLSRTVTVAVTGPPVVNTAGDRAEAGVGVRGHAAEVLRRAEQTASALAALGADTTVLDGGRATTVLTCAVDPYAAADVSWSRARPDAVVTGPTPQQRPENSGGSR